MMERIRRLSVRMQQSEKFHTSQYECRSAEQQNTKRATAVLVCAPPKVALKEICHSYSSTNNGDLLALADINLKVRAGEFLCIVGPSGCGKSTLLHLIAGLS